MSSLTWISHKHTHTIAINRMLLPFINANLFYRRNILQSSVSSPHFIHEHNDSVQILQNLTHLTQDQFCI